MRRRRIDPSFSDIDFLHSLSLPSGSERLSSPDKRVVMGRTEPLIILVAWGVMHKQAEVVAVSWPRRRGWGMPGGSSCLVSPSPPLSSPPEDDTYWLSALLRLCSGLCLGKPLSIRRTTPEFKSCPSFPRAARLPWLLFYTS